MATSYFDPNLLPMLELRTEQFRWIPEDRLFAAEISALGPGTSWLQRLYRDDPSQQGIWLRSHKTGDVRWLLLIYRKERRGWVSAWLFQSIDEGSEPIHVAIYNDSCPVEETVEVHR